MSLTKPILSIRRPKSYFITGPISVEVHRSVVAPLNHLKVYKNENISNNLDQGGLYRFHNIYMYQLGVSVKPSDGA